MEFKEYFRDELAYLHLLAEEFSEDCPELEQFLSPSSASDPDIEQLFEYFAFLVAKLRVKVEDAFPEITQNLLEKVWPLPLRPLPSTTIVKFNTDKGGEVRQLTKGTEIKGNSAQGREFIFQLCRDTNVHPLFLKNVNVGHSTDGSSIALTFLWDGSLDEKIWRTEKFSLFLGENNQLASLLLLWFQEYLGKVYLTLDNDKYRLAPNIVESFTLSEKNLILPVDVAQFWRLQLLQESIAIPHVNNFIDINLSLELPEMPLPESHEFTLTFNFNRVLPLDVVIDQNAFQVNCVPAVNLFERESEVYLSSKHHHTITAPETMQIYTIKRVYSPYEPHNNIRGDNTEYLPVTEFTATRFSTKEHFFYRILLDRDVKENPRHTLSFINNLGKEASLDQPFKCDLYCMNGNEIEELTKGDLCRFSEAVSSGLSFTNITKPTLPQQQVIDSHEHWALISHLSLSPLFLKDKENIKQLLSDLNFYAHHDLPLYQRYLQQLDGIKNIDVAPIDWMVKGLPVRGLKMNITLSTDHFDSIGEMYQFGRLLSEVFPFCLTDNNFLQVNLINAQTQEMWSLNAIQGSRGAM